MVSRGGIDNFHHAGGIGLETGDVSRGISMAVGDIICYGRLECLVPAYGLETPVPEVSSNTGRKADSMPVMCTTGCTLTPSR